MKLIKAKNGYIISVGQIGLYPEEYVAENFENLCKLIKTLFEVDKDEHFNNSEPREALAKIRGEG